MKQDPLAELKASTKPIRVFISHKQEDAVYATLVHVELWSQDGVTAYLDLMDPDLVGSPDRVTDHIHEMLRLCTHLIAVVSSRTQESWWVPFEIGLATERDYPIATYAIDEAKLPDFLRKWPYLTSIQHVSAYVREAKAASPGILAKDLLKVAASERRSYAADFHQRLRSALGQV